MHLEPHAALGWAIGNLGGADRRLRMWCVMAAVLPDIDAIPFIFGPQAYGHWHHTFGHNVFVWFLFTAWVTYRCRSVRAAVLSFLSFGSHLLTDAQLSGWNLYLFWPFSREGYLFPTAVGLTAPINTHLVYYSFVAVGLLAMIFKRTPLDMFSPRLDQLFISFFRRKNLVCGFCARKGNQTCDQCQRPVCIRHGAVRKRTTVLLLCPECSR
jgi:LexA-binding, inner membrane-associated putative hydrolase